MVIEEKYMKRCIALARGGLGNTSPNPMVGAVIVHDGTIIGEGFHRKIGEAHAEVNAVNSVCDESLFSSSTMYVSLEPCSHYGKTPPCAELIIQKRIPKVVVACLDPNPKVSGRGVQMLRDAGIEVVIGVLEKEAQLLNKAFMIYHLKHRPCIMLKWAQSVDGFIDRIRKDNSESPVVFSSSESRRVIHKLRSEYAAIMIGTNTALLDNPSLSVRHWIGHSPLRVVLDEFLHIPSSFHVLDGSVQTLIFTSVSKDNKKNIEYVLIDFNEPVLPQVLNELYERKINSLLVEGGSNLLNQFIHEGLWDEMRVEVAPVFLKQGVPSPDISGLNSYMSQKLTNTIKYYKY